MGSARSITLKRVETENTVQTVQTVQDQETSGSTTDDNPDDNDRPDDNTVQRTITKLNTVQKKTEDINNMDDMDDKSHSLSNSKKPTPVRCGDCPEYYVEPGWLACKVVDEKVKNLDSCPQGKTW